MLINNIFSQIKCRIHLSLLKTDSQNSKSNNIKNNMKVKLWKIKGYMRYLKKECQVP